MSREGAPLTLLRPAPPTPKLVETLRNVLAMAERGELLAVAIAGELSTGGEVLTALSLTGRAGRFTLAGAIVRLQHRVQRLIDEEL